MKLFQIFNNMCYYDMTPLYTSLAEAQSHYPPDVHIVETPDYVFESWGYDDTKEGDDRFIKPTPPEGWEYDENTGTFYNIELQKEQEKYEALREARLKLAESDYKIIKYTEYIAAGLEAPYDIVELHAERQEYRDTINELETELKVEEE